MPGFGVGPYGLMPYGTVTAAYDDQLATALGSSRRIDFKTGTYSTDATTGGFDHMDDVYQRIGLLLAYADKPPKLIGDTIEADMEAVIRKALAPLTTARPPYIRITKIETTTFGGTSQTAVRFKKWDDDTEHSLEL